MLRMYHFDHIQFLLSTTAHDHLFDNELIRAFLLTKPTTVQDYFAYIHEYFPTWFMNQVCIFIPISTIYCLKIQKIVYKKEIKITCACVYAGVQRAKIV